MGIINYHIPKLDDWWILYKTDDLLLNDYIPESYRMNKQTEPNGIHPINSHYAYIQYNTCTYYFNDDTKILLVPLNLLRLPGVTVALGNDTKSNKSPIV